jgi:hypothetical protein
VFLKLIFVNFLGRKLVKVYANWADANQNNAFCSDSSSCIDVVAVCTLDPQQPTSKFCKCPYGYQIKDNNERCGKEFQKVFFLK